MGLAVLCPGQGGQHAGLFDLVGADSEGRTLLARAGATAGFDLEALARDADRRFANAIAQPLICAAQALTWSLLGPRLAAAGIAPSVFAGYSVGELAAHACAGALSTDDTIVLAGARAAAMDAASRPGDGLVAVRGLATTAVAALCATHGAQVAIVNGEDQTLVGGPVEALDAIVAALDGAAQRLPVAVAAHTPWLSAAATAFRARLEVARWQRFAVPVIAGIDASMVRDATTAIDVLARQVATTIHWSACMDGLRERGVTVCLELGPGNALCRMMRERHRDVACRSVDDFRSLAAVVAWMVHALA